MPFMTLILLFAAAFSCASGFVLSIGLHKVIDPPAGWMRYSPPPSDYILRLRINLSQPELAEHPTQVQKLLSESYGLHPSDHFAANAPGPSPSDGLLRVEQWLASHGLSPEDLEHSAAGDWISVQVPVRTAEAMLQTVYSVFMHRDTDERIVRTLSYRVPEYLARDIDSIEPTTAF